MEDFQHPWLIYIIIFFLFIFFFISEESFVLPVDWRRTIWQWFSRLAVFRSLIRCLSTSSYKYYIHEEAEILTLKRCFFTLVLSLFGRANQCNKYPVIL